MKCDTPFETYSDLCDLFNENFKTGNWGVTLQNKNNSYACNNVPSDLEWIWNWSFIGQ